MADKENRRGADLRKWNVNKKIQTNHQHVFHFEIMLMRSRFQESLARLFVSGQAGFSLFQQNRKK